MSPHPASPPCPPRLPRALPVWLCAGIAVLVALILLRAPAFVIGGDGHGDPAVAGALATPDGSATAETTVTIDDDNGDDAVDPMPAAAFVRGNGGPLVSTAPRADAVGLDPPGVPPPEADALHHLLHGSLAASLIA